MYKQNLYKILDNYIKPDILKKYNKTKKWLYGYNKEHDIIIISKTGQIGEIYEIEKEDSTYCLLLDKSKQMFLIHYLKKVFAI